MYNLPMAISKCRLCSGSELRQILSLGNQFYTGIFPSTPLIEIPSGLLELVVCENCELVQLGSTFDQDLMYGDNYGYESSLNHSMVSHLKELFNRVIGSINLRKGDCVLDIGSNDSTYLNFYREFDVQRIGIDPTIMKFKEKYDADTLTCADFFTATNYFSIAKKPARIITSIAMMYDLEEPILFAKDIWECLDPEGVWFFEQSYFPLMVERLAYDTICHEHLEYYTAKTIAFLLEQANFVVKQAWLNDSNGGSIAILAEKSSPKNNQHSEDFLKLIENERNEQITSVSTMARFTKRVEEHRKEFKALLNDLAQTNKVVIGLGASTKGNVLLQYCNVDKTLISLIGEVNPNKFGCVTPGSHIPIVPEEEAFLATPDYIVILPWHFRETFINKLESHLELGAKVVFPLPEIQILAKGL